MLIAPVQPSPAAQRSERLRIRHATPFDTIELAALKRRIERRCYAHLGSPEALSVRLHRRCTAWYLLGRITCTARTSSAVGSASAGP